MGVDVTVAASASVHGVVLGLYRKYVQQTPATKLYCDVALAIQKALRQWHNHLTSRLIIDASSVISPSADEERSKFSGVSDFSFSLSGRLLRKIIFCKIMLGV